MYTPWMRTFSITKEVFRSHVLLKIPFQTIPVQDLRVESWQAYKEGNIMHILLQREGDDCLVTKMLKDKREDYRFAVYPGERLR
jgi:hypothetical protein